MSCLQCAHAIGCTLWIISISAAYPDWLVAFNPHLWLRAHTLYCEAWSSHHVDLSPLRAYVYTPHLVTVTTFHMLLSLSFFHNHSFYHLWACLSPDPGHHIISSNSTPQEQWHHGHCARHLFPWDPLCSPYTLPIHTLPFWFSCKITLVISQAWGH